MDDLEEVQQSSGTTESGGLAQSVNSVPSESSTMQLMFLQFLIEFEQCREDEERRRSNGGRMRSVERSNIGRNAFNMKERRGRGLSRESSPAADHQVVQQSVQHHPSLDKHGMSRT